MSTNLSTRRILVAAVVAAIGASGAYFTVAHASGLKPAPFRPLSSVVLPPRAAQAIDTVAAQAGVASSDVSEAGATAADQPYRATLVAGDRAGRTLVAFVSTYSVTSFRPAGRLFSDGPLAVLEGTRGTPTELREVGISIVVKSSVARVDVRRLDGSTTTVPLTQWVGAPYASASLTATSRGEFPTAVSAFDQAGRLVDRQNVDLTVVR
jgi:hypothetical protein